MAQAARRAQGSSGGAHPRPPGQPWPPPGIAAAQSAARCAARAPLPMPNAACGPRAAQRLAPAAQRRTLPAAAGDQAQALHNSITTHVTVHEQLGGVCSMRASPPHPACLKAPGGMLRPCSTSLRAASSLAKHVLRGAACCLQPLAVCAACELHRCMLPA